MVVFFLWLVIRFFTLSLMVTNSFFNGDHSFFNGDQLSLMVTRFFTLSLMWPVTYVQVTDQASSPLLPKTHSSINVCTNAVFYSTWLELIKGAELHVSASKSIYSLTDILLYILFVISLQNLLNFSFVSSFSLRNHILRSNSYCLIGYFFPSSSCPWHCLKDIQ